MTVYLTKTWGLGSPVGPLQFSQEGWRARARASLKPGDFVVICGTQGAETIESERGRLLGLMEPTTEVVTSLDFPLRQQAADYDDDGRYKWPFGLLNRGAWHFAEPRPLLRDVIDRPFHMDAAQGIVALTEDEAVRILALPRFPVPLMESVKTIARTEGEDVARRRGAPPPTTTRTGSMHMRRAPAHTYALRLEGGSPLGFKIGWAFDFKARLRGFNQVAMPDLGGLRYRAVFTELWPTAMDAYRMEQAILKDLNAQRHPRNREIITGISEDDLLMIWRSKLGLRRRSV